MARRAVFVGLALACVGLFTGYFRESAGGPLHGVQSLTGGIAAPLQSFGSKAVAPLQDGWRWSASLVGARDRAAKLEAENRALTQQVIAARSANSDFNSERRFKAIASGLPAGYRQIEGAFINRSSNFFQLVRLDVGSADGVVRNSPVVAPGAQRAGAGRKAVLVGIVTNTTSHTATVEFVTAPGNEVSVEVQGGSQVGTLAADDAGGLTLSRVPREFPVRRGDIVLTGGYAGANLPSLYPRGLSIGRVQEFGSREPDTYQSVQIEPLVDVRQLSRALVLVPTSVAAKRRAEG